MRHPALTRDIMVDDDHRGDATSMTSIGDDLPDLRGWYESGWRRPLVEFVVTFGLWAGAMAVGLWADGWSVRVAMVIPLTLLSGQLFTLAHDAGHGSLATSRAVNAITGRLALVPSLHVFGLWRFHHDVHHRYTNLRARDFVWTPLSVSEYRSMQRTRRVLNRLYRHRSGLGLGLHYTIEIWAPRMLWPRRSHVVRARERVVVDSILLYVLVAGLALSAWAFVSVVDPGRAADPAFWASAALLLFVLPVIGTHWLIGFVIFLNHTHPDIVWYDDPAEWARRPVQLEGSAGVRFDPVRHLLLPRRIMNHTVHHLDPGVPLRSLARAQRGLVEERADDVVSWEWSPRRFREILTRCQLYDYEGQRWLTYEAAEEAT
jgi:omega-6 fatty acid desaturase (delta-12 desaturase)